VVPKLNKPSAGHAVRTCSFLHEGMKWPPKLNEPSAGHAVCACSFLHEGMKCPSKLNKPPAGHAVRACSFLFEGMKCPPILHKPPLDLYLDLWKHAHQVPRPCCGCKPPFLGCKNEGLLLAPG